MAAEETEEGTATERERRMDRRGSVECVALDLKPPKNEGT